MTNRDRTTIFIGDDLVRQAHGMISPHIRETAVERARGLESGEGEVWLKLENQQVTGSFKARGALARVATLTDAERVKGVVACSAGNHALGVAHACELYGIAASIYVPLTIDEARKKALEALPVTLHVTGETYKECEDRAIEAAAQQHKVFISPYNDPLVIAGQGTIGFELSRQIPNLEVVLLAVGGGGLAAGVAGYLKAIKPDLKVVGVCPINSAGLFDMVTGIPSEFTAHLETLSDSTAGAVQEGAITIGLCKALIDQWILVEESDIQAAMRYLFYEHRIVTEGAGALALAGYFREREGLHHYNCGLLVCGGNIAPKKFLSVVKMND